MRLRLLSRLVLGSTSILLVAAVLAGVVLEWHLTREQHQRLERELTQHSVLLASMFADQPLFRSAQLQERIRALGVATGLRYTVIAAQGEVLADSERQAEQLDNHAGRPELRAALQSPDGVSIATRPSGSVGQDLLYVARVLRGPQGEHRGWVRVARPLGQLAAERWAVRLALVGAFGFAGTVALAVAAVMARTISRPLAQLTDAAQALAAGETGVKLPPAGRDEIGRLVASFTTMSEQLEQRIDLLNRERQQLEAVLGAMHEGVVLLDGAGRIMLVNRVATSLLGLRAQVHGLPLWQTTIYQDVAQAAAVVLKTGAERQAVLDLALPGGTRHVLLQVLPLQSGGEPLRGALLVLNDHTARRRLDDMRRDFVANVSHELKTPLTVIQGILETVADSPTLEVGKRQAWLGKAQVHCQRLSLLVHDLLALSRLEIGHDRLERENVDLGHVIHEVVESQQPAAQAKGIRLLMELAEGAHVVAGDAELLRQMVDNLLSNALRYSPTQTQVRLCLARQGAQVELRVIDQGIGIPPEAQTRIFERFYRVDKARSRELGGTGLGLSIVKHVVQSHQGSVHVDSALGKGSTFTVRLPALTGD